MISVLFVPSVILLYEYGSMPLGLLLALSAFVATISLLDHPRGLIKLSLLAIGQAEPANVSLAVAVLLLLRIMKIVL